MSISVSKFILNKKVIKRTRKTNDQIVESCNHCGGAFKGSGEWESCLMCGRAKGHICSNCINIPQEKIIHDKS